MDVVKRKCKEIYRENEIGKNNGRKRKYREKLKKL
jgi:hypothetical protein